MQDPRNGMRAAGGDAMNSNSEIPGKVATPETSKGMDAPAGADSPKKGTDVKGFSGGGLISPFVGGEKLGGTEGAK